MNEKEQKAAAALYRQHMDTLRKLKGKAQDEIDEAVRHTHDWQAIRKEAEKLLASVDEQVTELEKLAERDGVKL